MNLWSSYNRRVTTRQQSQHWSCWYQQIYWKKSSVSIELEFLDRKLSWDNILTPAPYAHVGSVLHYLWLFGIPILNVPFKDVRYMCIANCCHYSVYYCLVLLGFNLHYHYWKEQFEEREKNYNQICCNKVIKSCHINYVLFDCLQRRCIWYWCNLLVEWIGAFRKGNNVLWCSQRFQKQNELYHNVFIKKMTIFIVLGCLYYATNVDPESSRVEFTLLVGQKICKLMYIYVFLSG